MEPNFYGEKPIEVNRPKQITKEQCETCPRYHNGICSLDYYEPCDYINKNL